MSKQKSKLPNPPSQPPFRPQADMPPIRQEAKIAPEVRKDPAPTPQMTTEVAIEKPKLHEENGASYAYEGIDSAPRNGTLIIVSETGKDKGVIVFWRKTRAFANATHKWETTGFFVHNITNLRLPFEPKYWRMRGIYEI